MLFRVYVCLCVYLLHTYVATVIGAVRHTGRGNWWWIFPTISAIANKLRPWLAQSYRDAAQKQELRPRLTVRQVMLAKRISRSSPGAANYEWVQQPEDLQRGAIRGSAVSRSCRARYALLRLVERRR
jgi:hypothetical protein